MSQPRQHTLSRENNLLTMLYRTTNSPTILFHIRTVLFVALVLLFTAGVQAQSTANYTFGHATNGSLTDTTGSTSLLALSTYHDDVASSVTNIGFTFYFMGTPYTQFSINSNGQMALGSSVIGNTGISSPSASLPLLVPMSADNAIRATGRVSYKVTGSNPSQVLTVTWNDLRVPFSSSVESGTYCSFQVRLYQATGVVEFVYGTMYNMGTAQTRAIFFSSNNTTGKVGVVENLLTTPTFNSTTTTATTYSFTGSASMTNLNSASDGSRTVFSFTPQNASPLDPTTISFSSVTGTGMTVNWVDNSSTETYFIVTRATDAGFSANVVTTAVTCTTTAGTGTTYSSTQTGLNFGTTYYYKIQAANEGLAPSSGLTGNQATTSPTLSGTKTVGATGDYTTLTAAFAAITSNGLAGNILLELQSSYTSGSETLPIVTPSTTYTGIYTVTVRPASDVVSTLTISGSNATAILDLNGAQNWTIDGRPGGTGSNKYLTVSNSNATGAAIRFINEASTNTVRNCILISTANTSTASGVVFFSTTTGSNGNDNNTLTNNDINGFGSAQGVFASGTTTTTAHNNSGNTISSNNIFDVYISSSSTTSTKFISISSGNTDWTIDGNKLYMSASRAYSGSASTQYGIHISNTSGNNFAVTNNTIGGNASDNSGTWSTTAGLTTYRMMEFSVGATTATSVQGNTIKNMSVITAFASAGSGGFTGMFFSSGAFNIGTVSGNTIGTLADTGSVRVTGSGATNSWLVVGYNIAATGGVNFTGNNFGGVTVLVNTATVCVNVYAVTVSGSSGNVTVNNNTIGGTVTNSIKNLTGNTTTNFNTRGFNITSTSNGTLQVTNNTVRNLFANSTNTGSSMMGIYIGANSASAVYTVSGNTVYNLVSATARTSSGSQGALIGIDYANTTGSAGNVFSGNHIYGLSNTAASGAVDIYGLYFSNASSSRSIIEKNFVRGITSTSSSTARYFGIYIATGSTVTRNNMVRIGIDSTTSVTSGHTIYGIWKETASYASTIAHNSVYLGGTGVAGTAGTMAFRKSGSTATDTLMNNIFVNARSNGAGTGKHYAVYLNNTTSLVINNNIYYANGTGGVLGTENGGTNDRTTLSAWQTATLQDANSAYGDPSFVAPTGSNVYADLHLNSTNPAEASGVALSVVTDDFDGSTRSGLTPTDIGADAGNFTLLDIVSPIISYTALGNGTTGNRTLTNFATITDNLAVSTGGSAPRFYYKRSTDGDVFNDNTNGTDGWKYVTATGSSPYSFTVDYSLLNGGTGVTEGNTIQYFVVAQDDANNWSSLPTGATASGNPPVQNINAKATTPNTYTITAGISGTKTVGSGGDYTTLTASGGLFSAINASALSGNLTVNIISDISTEDGTNSLGQISEDGVGGYTVTIQSDGNPWVISNGSALAVPMININGADRVTITGGTGDTRNLTFRNTHTTASSAVATIQFNTGSTSCTLKNLTIENNSTSATQGVVMVGSTGTSSVTLLNNVLRDATGGTTGAANNSFYMSNATGTVTMQYNKFINFINSGVNIANAASSCSFIGNSFYQTASAPASVTGATAFNGISLTTGTNSGHTISGNYVGGQDSLCGGSAYSNTASVAFKGIVCSTATTTPNSIQGNTIQNINLSGTGGLTSYGIYTLAGQYNVGTVTGNTIGHNSTANSITFAGNNIFYAILITATTTSNTQNNLIANLTASNTGTGTQIYGIYHVGNTVTNATITGNTMHSLSTASTKTMDVESGTSANTGAVIVGILTTSTSANQVISQNTLYNFSATTTAVTNVGVVGIGDNATATASFITRNKLYGFTNTAAGTTTLPGIVGIRPYSGAFTIANNMITLTNGANTNGVKIYGLSNAAGGTNNFYYNSVYIGGSPNTGSAISGAFVNVYSSSTSHLRNNILYNARTNIVSATGNHYAIAQNTVGTAFTSNHNLLVTTSASVVAFRTPTVYTFATWRASGAVDFQSFADITSTISSDSLFTNVSTGDLSIKTTTAAAWAVNQRGIPLVSQGDDYGATAVRTTALPGQTDVGADEMTPSSVRPMASPSAPPANNTTSNYTENGRTLGQLTFGAGGTPPTNINLTQYRGANPPGSLTGNYSNAYWNIDPTGGSGYSYDVVLHYDSTMLGTIPFESNIRVAKSNDGGSTWVGYTQLGSFANGVALDTVNNTVTVYGLTSFSDFALTDGSSPLPVELVGFTAVVQGRSVVLNWNTATEINANRFEVERAVPVEHHAVPEWTKVGEVTAAGNSNSPREYGYTDKLTRTGKFVYRLRMVDNDGKVQYSQWINTEVAAPKTFALLQNYPNPFNPTTKISFEVPKTSAVKVMVYNATGELVRVLENGILEAGVYERTFDAKGLSSGMYLYIMQADGVQFSKKMLLMK